MKFDKNIFEKLAKSYSDTNTKVSIFIPTDRTGNGQAAKIRLKNELNKAADILMDENIQENPMSKNDALGYLNKGFELLEQEDFWIHQSDGLAVFMDEETFEYYSMPIDFKSFTYVDNVFYLTPMLAAITDKSRFFILALSQNEVRFFEGAQHSITPVIISDLVPESLEESMAAIDIEHPAELQSHSGGNNPIFHGQGGEKDGKTDRIVDYFRMIDDGLMEMLHDEKVPMIIAGVDNLIPMYKEISNYSNIVETHISGNVEHDDPTLLHEKAWAALTPTMNEEFAAQKDNFMAMMPQEKASLSINDIAPAALNGKIETLFVDKDAGASWGTYFAEKNEVKVQTKQDKTNACLVNFSAIATYLQGGTVYVTSREEMPHNVSVMNAVYRY